MKQVTNSFKNNIKKYGRQLDAIITFGNTTISKEHINSIIPSFNTTLFKSVMQAIEIDSNIKIEKGTKINVKVGVGFNNSAYEYVEYNNYKTQDPKKQEDTESYKIIAYDRMIESMIDYDLQITKKITVREYLIKIFERLNWSTTGIPDVFVNSEKKIDPSVHVGIGYTFRDVLDELATITGSFIFIKNSIPTLAYITDTEEKIDEEYLSEDDVTIGSKYIINSLVFSRAEESDNIYRKDDISIDENGLYEFKISDNQILSTNDRVDFIEDLFNYLKTIQFYIFDIKSPGIMWFELADMFNICVHGGEYPVILLNDEITVDQDLEERLYADEPYESETEYKYADETDKKINQTYIIVDKQNQKITQLVEENTEQSKKIAEVEQTVDGISQKVQDIEDITETTTGITTIELDNCYPGVLLSLRIIGNNTVFEQLYPADNLFPSDDLYPYGDSRIIVTDEKGNQKEYELNVTDVLRERDGIYDEYVLEKEQAKIIRRINKDGTIKETEEEENLGTLTITLAKGRNTIKIKNYTASIIAKYAIQNNYTDIFATKVEMDSNIKQSAQEIDLSVNKKLEEYSTTEEMKSEIKITADEINSEVSKKVGEDEVISKINQSAEQIQINANKISLERKGN